jgi:hypothetical protein
MLITHSNTVREIYLIRTDRQRAPTSCALEAPTLTLALATPHSVIHVIVERVQQARLGDGTLSADALSLNYSDTILGKKRGCRVLSTFAISHPFGVHSHPP